MDSTPKRLRESWRDNEIRMNSLYSPFRANRAVNPQDWDNKLKFWTGMVIESCREQNEVCFDCGEIAERFRMKDKSPLGMGRVIKELHRQGRIQNATDLQSSVEGGWMSWGFGVLVKKPVSWTFNTVTGRNEKDLQGTYVVYELLQEKSEAILAEHYKAVEYNSTDHVVEYTSLFERCRPLCKDERTFDLALLHLRKTKQVCFEITSDGIQVLKFASPNSRRYPSFNEVDLDILRLKQSIQLMKVQLDKLGNEVERYRQEIILNLKNGNKTMAKNLLRRKRSVSKTLENKHITLDNIENLLHKIQEAETDKMIIDAYKAGSAALKQTLQINELTPNAVETVMADVQDVLEDHQEITDVMFHGNESIAEIAGVDKDELERELEELLAQDTHDVSDLGLEFNQMHLGGVEDLSALSPQLSNPFAANNPILMDYPTPPRNTPQSSTDMNFDLPNIPSTSISGFSTPETQDRTRQRLLFE
ncbi:charged multivesicular body protein 7-like [Glandiceps talaboti]